MSIEIEDYIYEKVTNLSNGKCLSRTDNIFGIEINSLVMVELIVDLSAHYKINLSIEDMTESVSIDRLARKIHMLTYSNKGKSQLENPIE